jgi:hypothetical protein
MKDTARCSQSHLCKYVISKFYVYLKIRWDNIFLFFYVYALVSSVLSRISALTVMQHILNESLIYNEMWVKECPYRTLGSALQKGPCLSVYTGLGEP